MKDKIKEIEQDLSHNTKPRVYGQVLKNFGVKDYTKLDKHQRCRMFINVLKERLNISYKNIDEFRLHIKTGSPHYKPYREVQLITSFNKDFINAIKRHCAKEIIYRKYRNGC